MSTSANVRVAFIFIGAIGLPACTDDSKPKGSATDAGGTGIVFQSGEFAVDPGAEKYVCYTKTLTGDTYVDRFESSANANVHHMVLVRTLAPESDAPFECPTFFKTTWIPLFAKGTGDAELTIPTGSSVSLPKGTQLLIQLHLLNSGTQTSRGSASVTMRSVDKTTDESGIYAFGTTVISLPPNQVSSVQNDCTVNSDVNVFAVFPHMHTLGQSLSFSTGPDATHLTEQFRVQPWNFGEQFIAPKQVQLHAGELTRTICTYDNTRSTPVTFGESTNDEMCFFTVFRTGYTGLDGCLNLGGFGAVTPGGNTDAGDAGTDQ